MTPWLPKTSCGIHICGCGPCPVALVQHISRPQTSELCPHTKKVSEDGGRGGGGPPLIHNIAIVPKIPPSRKMGIYFPKLRITLGPTVQFHRLRAECRISKNRSKLFPPNSWRIQNRSMLYVSFEG